MKRIVQALLVVGVATFAACSAQVDEGDASRASEGVGPIIGDWSQHLVTCTTPPIQFCAATGVIPDGYFVQRTVEQCPDVGVTSGGLFRGETGTSMLTYLWKSYYNGKYGPNPIVGGHFADESSGVYGLVSPGAFRQYLAAFSPDLNWFQPFCHYYWVGTPVTSATKSGGSGPVMLTISSVCGLSGTVELACFPPPTLQGKTGCVGCDGPIR